MFQPCSLLLHGKTGPGTTLLLEALRAAMSVERLGQDACACAGMHEASRHACHVARTRLFQHPLAICDGHGNNMPRATSCATATTHAQPLLQHAVCYTSLRRGMQRVTAADSRLWGARRYDVQLLRLVAFGRGCRALGGAEQLVDARPRQQGRYVLHCSLRVRPSQVSGFSRAVKMHPGGRASAGRRRSGTRQQARTWLLTDTPRKGCTREAHIATATAGSPGKRRTLLPAPPAPRQACPRQASARRPRAA